MSETGRAEKHLLSSIKRRQAIAWSQGSVTVIYPDGRRTGFPIDTEVRFVVDKDVPAPNVVIIHHGHGHKPEQTLVVQGRTEDIERMRRLYEQE